MNQFSVEKRNNRNSRITLNVMSMPEAGIHNTFLGFQNHVELNIYKDKNEIISCSLVLIGIINIR